ncbi:MAG: hypothetical protein ACRD9R_07925, partial [Pyrinomonadaceae bacterium]
MDGHDPNSNLPDDDDAATGQTLTARALRERLRSIKSSGERRTLSGLARGLGRLPADRARAALEVGAQLASVSLRAAAEFLRAAPAAAQALDAEELRQWGELGRRLASADVETGVRFFAAEAESLAAIPNGARARLFRICERQLVLSTSIAVETFQRAPQLAAVVRDAALLAPAFEVAEEIARRSARHSADFLAATPAVFDRLQGIEDKGGVRQQPVTREAIELAGAFAARAGGIAADVWVALPEALARLDAAKSLLLFRTAEDFLGRGGAAALHVFVAGGEALRLVPQEVFAEWTGLLHA